jgi:3-dehydroquinate dehydratase-2
MTSSKKKVLVVNGPNLNLLSKRDKRIYGMGSMQKAQNDCRALARELDLEVIFKQSNIEGELVEHIQDAIVKKFDGIVINAAAYTHTSVAIRDALEMFSGKKVEIHISNIFKREEFRKHSLISDMVDAVISGFGTNGYTIALLGINNLIIEK